MKKITLTEFWNSKNDLAIHCDTEEKAKTLLKAFDKLGKKWAGGNSYLNSDCIIKRGDVCYSNTNRFCGYEYYRLMGYKIYEFDEVYLEN